MAEPSQETTDSRLFFRLRRAYLVALSVIAIAVMTEYFVVESFLGEQAKDARIINVAGRQRMLSQRIVKLSLLPPTLPLSNTLEQDLQEWSNQHDWLKKSLQTDPVFEDLRGLDSLQRQLKEEVTKLALETARPQGAEGVERQNAAAATLNSKAEFFLNQMDEVVDQLAFAATARVDRLRLTKRWIAAATIGVLLLELFFIFQPISRFVRQQFERLRIEKDKHQAATKRATVAFQEREASLRELFALNKAIDQTALFATLREDGTILRLSRKLATLLGVKEIPEGFLMLADLLHPDEGRRAAFAQRITGIRSRDWGGEWHIVSREGQEYWLEVALVSAHHGPGETEIFLLASDVSERKKALATLDEINEERLREEVERGKLRTRQIADAQEKERLRVARDLHDGIGQKLTALKFSLESIRPEEVDKTKKKINELKALSKEIILGIRLATFNLTPPELLDYGLVTALEKMARELSRLTGERIVFRKENEIERMAPAWEINLYRIVQEAVNNAIKHASANYILVTLSSGPELISVTIDDDGVGFEREELRHSTDGSGLGLSSMEERVHNLNGRLFLRSEEGEGTRLVVNIPKPNPDNPLP
ncbi:PAS domain S-box protein [Neolewinella aurantiaca]|uniref:Oxygen sensor histidine kinase NreB n=1 Tax=Neolewinella aurantiaca TaxID=2602767 RepID=A0A5C7FZX3_9BACT|nr:ATP-binding protein [Neolewinella aurantiaca]TXF90896.1 PAS domain S-box protein [Neolewinella aurantiaca]